MDLKSYIEEKKRIIDEKELIERDIYLEERKDVIVTLVGPRRAGKSSLMMIKAKKLPREEYLFVDFEDYPFTFDMAMELTKAHTFLYGKEPKFLFLDEIHALPHWEKFLHFWADRGKYIFASGSSSKLLSREIATQLRGRALSTEVLPLSFREYLRFKNVKWDESFAGRGKLLRALEDYLKNGGFPSVVLGKLRKEEFNANYLEGVVYKDLVERFNIHNIRLAKYLIEFLSRHSASIISANSIYKTLKDIAEVSNKSIYIYLSYLEIVYFVFSLKRFSTFKGQERSLKKYYVVDPGLIPEGMGRKMETAVFLNLRKKEGYYWRDYEGKEVDFVIKEGNAVKELIQVSYANDRDEIERREIRSLLKASELLNCKDLKVITWDYEGEEEVKGKKIKFIPLWRWLLFK